jgi:predicted naringenin-chalcone synthase
MLLNRLSYVILCSTSYFNYLLLHPSIKSIGTAVPPHKISQELHYSILESANGMSREEKLHLRKLYTRSGISSRHSVLEEFGRPDSEANILFKPSQAHTTFSVGERMGLYEKYAADLCAEAVQNCFSQLSEQPKVTHLVTFSCTGMIAPGIDIGLLEKLKLSRNIERTCINFMGCYAGIIALKTAFHIARSQPDAVVLVAGVELCTLHYQKNEKPDQLVANAIFGDGAAAAIISAAQEGGKLRLTDFYAEYDPAGGSDMIWTIGNLGFDLRLSADVPRLIKENLPGVMQRMWTSTGLKQEEIEIYALHPGGVKILEACEHALKISREQNAISYEILKEYGNMSSVTVLFVLQKHLDSFSTKDKGKKLLASAFGPGLTMESMIAEVI